MTTTASTETLVGITTRHMTFTQPFRYGIHKRSIPTPVPAGTEVYVTRIKDDGRCTLRVCGTLIEASYAHITDVEPA